MQAKYLKKALNLLEGYLSLRGKIVDKYLSLRLCLPVV